jgi:hypothetical protein
MKRLAVAIVISILIAGQLFSLAAAAAPSAASASTTSCGSTYVVQRGDYLARIARNCGTTVATILANNRQIFNANWIYPGEVLNMTGTVIATPPPVYYNPNHWYGNYYYPGGWWYGGYYNPYPTTIYTSPQVSLSTYRANAGNSLTVYVRGFPANSNIDYRIGQEGSNWTTAYDGKVGSDGTTSLSITIPSSASKGDYWVVHVLTTEGKVGAQAYSSLIYITG